MKLVSYNKFIKKTINIYLELYLEQILLHVFVAIWWLGHQLSHVIDRVYI